jgi:hypothetical protein
MLLTFFLKQEGKVCTMRLGLRYTKTLSPTASFNLT